MRRTIFILLLGVCLASACSSPDRSGSNTGNRPGDSLTAAPIVNNSDGSSGSGRATDRSDKADEIAVTKKDCEATDTGDNALLKSQTFPVTFEPFKNTCFVTSYNPEFDDPPLESEIAIYRGNKRVFDFPGQFNGVKTGCWVEAVAFQDLNSDALTDIIVVGKCSAKTAPYNENVLYINTGKAFVTNEAANYELSDFKKAGEITDFVKRNQKLFFK
jgi:hypothetical protein